MTIDMELFSYYWQLVQSHGWPVYDHLPPQGQPVQYPFVMIGEIDTTSGGDKSALSGKVNLTIDVWGKREDRPTVSQIANGIFLASIGALRTQHFTFVGQKDAQQVQLMTDTSVANTVFFRGMVSIELTIQ
ncbi:hypothetical protein [Lacticaseibacillus mingshuiensis]|uniref:hypothetical protein n=1 Tax=Lacticaseibacillus mingshuiensis TaxID=2799574 RepID=UPI00194F3817|nr:hypothetical protein [Lacticaseibacillus mingshuiensis]